MKHSTEQVTMTPFIKWAGGKKQLLKTLCAHIPAFTGTYYEPFIGAGALFLHLCPERAVINECNEYLINVYRQLKEQPSALIALVASYDAVPCDKARYLELRCRYNAKIAGQTLDIECAALFIWLNKHCFNGLYRVNSKGFFNVPYNNKVSGASLDHQNARALGEYLQRADVSICNLDFEQVCRTVQPGDFVYFDSPYVPVSRTANFIEYTRQGFTLDDHTRLAALFRRLDALGALLLLSNNNVALVHELYAGYTVCPVEVRRSINCDAQKRSGREVLITNFEPRPFS